MPLTDRDVINSAPIGNKNQKVKAARDFLFNSDKLKTGEVPLANFLKVARIFGLQINQNQIKTSDIGMVDYERALNNLI